MTVDIAMLSEMLPCPFCGDVEELDVREREGGWLAICGACAGHMYADSRAGAIAGWNTRFEASLPPSAPVDAGGGNKGLREALQGLLTLVDGCLTAEMIAEGMHAGLRKGSDAPDAAALWRAIADSKTSAWSDAARFAVDPFFTMWGKKALADARALLATPSVLAESTSNDCLLVAEAVRDWSFLPKQIGRLELGDRPSDNECYCSHSHVIPDGAPLYWPQGMGQYDDSDAYCLEHAVELAESDSGWCQKCIAADFAAERALSSPKEPKHV